MKDISMDSYRVQHTHITRNTDTIKNTHVRKLTSIALMAIMVGGGLTFAIPGMEPAYAAQISSNPNLKVSAEGQNASNEIAATNIVEVVVIDDLNSDFDSPTPIVTVDGTSLELRQETEEADEANEDATRLGGAWYGYFASADIQNSGLIDSDGNDAITAAEQGAVNALVTEPVPALNTLAADDNNPDTPDTLTTTGINVLLIEDLSDSFQVIYERANGDQTVSMQYDDPDSGVSLDRETYPQGTGVVITLDDMALNVDPTAADVWWFGEDGTAYYNAIPIEDTARITAEGKILIAEGVRDGKIETANMTKNTNIAAADPVAAESKADTRRTTSTDRAEAIIADVIATQPQKIRAALLLPNTETFSDTDPPNEFSDPPIPAEIIDYKGLAQVEYEIIEGFKPFLTVTVAPDRYLDAGQHRTY